MQHASLIVLNVLAAAVMRCALMPAHRSLICRLTCCMSLTGASVVHVYTDLCVAAWGAGQPHLVSWQHGQGAANC
jgi:hypothetical protein